MSRNTADESRPPLLNRATHQQAAIFNTCNHFWSPRHLKSGILNLCKRISWRKRPQGSLLAEGVWDDKLAAKLRLPLWAHFVESVIENPPATVLKEDEDFCACCYAPFGAEDTIPVRLPCSGQHVICKQCAQTWFVDGMFQSKSHFDCPHCREKIVRQSFFRDLDSALVAHRERQKEVTDRAVSLELMQDEIREHLAKLARTIRV